LGVEGPGDLLTFGQLKMRVSELEKENNALKKIVKSLESGTLERAQEMGDGDEFANEVSVYKVPKNKFG